MTPAQSPPGMSRDDTEPAWLTRNYYSTRWMQGAVCVAEIQIVFFTCSLLTFLGFSNTSALQSFLNYLTWFLVTQPLVTYCYLYLGIVSEEDEMACTVKRLKQFFWSNLLHMNSSSFSGRISSIYPLMFVLFSCGAPVAFPIILYFQWLIGLCFCYSIVIAALPR